jgi:hypothetical protein
MEAKALWKELAAGEECRVDRTVRVGNFAGAYRHVIGGAYRHVTDYIYSGMDLGKWKNVAVAKNKIL